jgi:hypothetical protein
MGVTVLAVTPIAVSCDADDCIPTAITAGPLVAHGPEQVRFEALLVMKKTKEPVPGAEVRFVLRHKGEFVEQGTGKTASDGRAEFDMSGSMHAQYTRERVRSADSYVAKFGSGLPTQYCGSSVTSRFTYDGP